MTVADPNVFFVELSEEEIESFYSTSRYLENIYNIINRKNCNALQSGQHDFEKDKFNEVANWLRTIAIENPCKMI